MIIFCKDEILNLKTKIYEREREWGVVTQKWASFVRNGRGTMTILTFDWSNQAPLI